MKNEHDFKIVTIKSLKKKVLDSKVFAIDSPSKETSECVFLN